MAPFHEGSGCGLCFQEGGVAGCVITVVWAAAGSVFIVVSAVVAGLALNGATSTWVKLTGNQYITIAK